MTAPVPVEPVSARTIAVLADCHIILAAGRSSHPPFWRPSPAWT